MRIGICEFTTLGASFEEDLAAYRAAGAGGIGVCEIKLGEGAAERLRESGLVATHCVPAVPSILPLPLMEGPDEPEERVEALCASVRRLAELEPVCVLFLTGPADGREDAREIVREGIWAIAAAGEAAGVRVALEPVHPTQADVFSFVHTIPDALELIGDRDVGILFDTWHMPDVEDIGPYIDRIAGVHVADRREPTRSHFDRVLPGDGVLDLGAIFCALEAGRLRRLVRRRDLLRQRHVRRRVPGLALGRRGGRAGPPRGRGPGARVGGAVTRRYDAVAIGSGINSLVAAALLAKAGWRVCVLERNDWLGGAIRTAEITEPGFVHEVFASWHPLFTGSAAYAELKDDLEARGLEYLNTELPTATLFPDGESAVPDDLARGERRRARPGWERTVGEFMPNAELAFGVLDRAVVARRAAARGEGAAAARPPGARRVHGQRARELPRLGRPRRSRTSGRTACSRRGCCTPGSVPTPPRRASWRR